MSLAVCLKIIYSGSSFSMGSVVLLDEKICAILYNFGLFYIHPPLCPEDFEVSTKESRLPISEVLNVDAWC